MDLNRIWLVFGVGGDDNDKDMKKEVEEFQNSPYFKINMFIKMLNYGISFKKKSMKFFNNLTTELDPNDISEAGDFMLFSRGWFWISQCDLNNEIWREDLLHSNRVDLLECLNIMVLYYQNVEEYERCAFLKKIVDFITSYKEVGDK